MRLLLETVVQYVALRFCAFAVLHVRTCGRYPLRTYAVSLFHQALVVPWHAVRGNATALHRTTLAYFLTDMFDTRPPPHDPLFWHHVLAMVAIAIVETQPVSAGVYESGAYLVAALETGAVGLHAAKLCGCRLTKVVRFLWFTLSRTVASVLFISTLPTLHCATPDATVAILVGTLLVQNLRLVPLYAGSARRALRRRAGAQA